MFTGIVEELGTVRRRTATDLEINARTVLDDAELGASIAVNGCCLTVVEFDQSAGWWRAELTEETWNRTSLGALALDDGVNLERPLRLADRLGGHIVQGHVDTTGDILVAQPNLRIGVAAGDLRYVVEKGSITVDGISLTVSAVGPDYFEAAIIPHTAAVTNLGRRQPGERVNLEFDIVAKHIDRLVGPTLAAMTGMTPTSEAEGESHGY